jgi:type I restriction enzyme S subunit
MSKSWQEVPLADIAKPISRTVAVVPNQDYRTIGVKWWGEGAYERQTIDGSHTAARTLSLVRQGDLIINKIWVRHGSTAIAGADVDGCAASGEFPTFTLDNSRVVPQWLHWQTKTRDFWAKCDALSQGTSGKNRIKPESFLTIRVPLPPLAEQRRVVARIEELAAQIQNARTLRQQAAEEAEALVTGRSAELFRESSGDGTQSLESIAVLERGKFSHRPRNDPRFFGGTHPWIQIGEIQSAGKFIRRWSETLNDDGLSISKKFPKGTVLISIAATIGSVGILDFDCCFPDSIVGVTPRAGTESEFLYYFLGYLRSHLEEIAPQSAQKNINLQILSPLPVPKLTLPEQRRIVSELDALQAEVDALKRLQTETAAELDALLPSVLSQAFAGEL